VTSRTFTIPKRKGAPKAAAKESGAIDIAARYFVYKLYEATDGRRMLPWVLHGMGENAATVSRAVERGWAILGNEHGSPRDRSATLTDEGRRLARRGRS
jgi:hypothetical protein